MICFFKTDTPGLYEGRQQEQKTILAESFVWFVLRERDNAPDRMLLAEALHDVEHKGSFVFSGRPLPKEVSAREAFISEVLLQTQDSGRGILWMEDPHNAADSEKSVLLINAEGTCVAYQYVLQLIDMMKLVVLGASMIETDGNSIMFLPPAGTNTRPSYIEPIDLQDKNAVYQSELVFEGEDRGCIRVLRWIKKKVFALVFNPGFEWSFMQNGNVISRTVSLFPMDAEDGNENVDFCFCINPINISGKGRRGRHTQLHVNADTIFCSCYTTIYGRTLRLGISEKSKNKGHFVFEQAGSGRTEENAHRLAPEGDFLIETPESAETTLLCGLSGLEYFKIGQGAFITFTAGCPACAENFPLPVPSPFGPPFDPNADILTDRTTTSWATVAKGAAYVSQARGLELFNTDSHTAETGLLHHEQWETLPESQSPYPLVPFKGVCKDSKSGPFTEEVLEEYEKTILSTVRRKSINKDASCGMPCGVNSASSVTVVTPSGYMVEAAANRWEKIHLAQNLLPESGQWCKLSFDLPGEKLVQAFSTSNLFLVAVNPENLGKFSNQINIQDWNFTFHVGDGCEYGEYRNVMIIKSRKGKLYDLSEEDKSLCANPQLWTQAEDFASPGGDDSQQILLASWLKEYCRESLQNDTNPYFSNFNKILQDPDWRGILFLKATLTKENIPSSLSCITSGIHNMDKFVLHHLGIHLNPIERQDNILQQNNPSSLFGLIYYVHPDYHENTQVGVEPEAEEYDFQMLTLKSLFYNSTVQSFESSAQLVVNSLFGGRVKKRDSAYNWIFLTGSCQEREGVPTYELRCDENMQLQFESNILNRISLHSVEMQSLDSGKSDLMFTLNGVVEFTLWKKNGKELDIFSYGTLEAKEDSVAGLNFSNMQIIQKDEKPLYLSMDNLRFDLPNSTVRPGSLFPGLKLQLVDFMESNEEPATLGYAPVLMDGAAASAGGKKWMGLRSNISLGTLGELAGKLSLTTQMLIAWTVSTDKSELYIGLKLPGTGEGSGILSLQNILKLSLGQITLCRDKDSFLLMISDIAVKLFGLKKLPPEGNTMFYLFGPHEEEESKELGWFALYNK